MKNPNNAAGPVLGFYDNDGRLRSNPFTECAVELLKKHGVDTDKLLTDMRNGINPEGIGYRSVTPEKYVEGDRQYFKFFRNEEPMFTMVMESGPVVITAEGASSTIRFREVDDEEA